MMFHPVSYGYMGFTNVLFITDGTFKKIDGCSSITGENIWDVKIFLSLITVIVTFTSELWAGTTLFMSTTDVFGRKARRSIDGYCCSWQISGDIMIELCSH